MSRGLDVASSTFASVVRLGAGLTARPAPRRPEKLLELYEFEACPFCRRVREELSELDFDVRVFPCPRGGTRFRPRVMELGHKQLFPFLVDPNTGRSMYESPDIVQYLRDTYGVTGWRIGLGPLGMLGRGLASAARAGHGRAARPSRLPERELELWSFEASPFSRLVRETLCELELPHVLHNVARGSHQRDAFVARSGKMMVPYLVDPNAPEGPGGPNPGMFESADIVRYLNETYAVPAGS